MKEPLIISIDRDQLIAAYSSSNDTTKNILETIFGKENLVPIDMTDRIKSYDDACNALSLDLELPYPENSTDKYEIVVNAFVQLMVICRALNGGWTPNWNNEDECKWWPWFDWRGSSFGFLDHQQLL